MKSFLQYLQENGKLSIPWIDDDADNATKQLFNTTSEKLKNQTVPSELQQALQRYVGGVSSDINTKLRAGEIDPLAKQMDELIHKFGIKRDAPTTVWRVMPSKYIKSGIEPGFLSTTVDRKIAFSRAARIPESSVLQIDIPAGVPHVSNTTGNYTGENELLFGRNQNLKIDANPKTIKVIKDIPAVSADPDADFPVEARPREQRVTKIPVHRATIVTDTPNPTQTPKPVTPTPKPKTPKTLTTPTLPEVPKLPEVPETPMASKIPEIPKAPKEPMVREFAPRGAKGGIGGIKIPLIGFGLAAAAAIANKAFGDTPTSWTDVANQTLQGGLESLNPLGIFDGGSLGTDDVPAELIGNNNFIESKPKEQPPKTNTEPEKKDQEEDENPNSFKNQMKQVVFECLIKATK